MEVTKTNLQSICNMAGGKCRSGEWSLGKYRDFMNMLEDSNEEVRDYIMREMRGRLDPRNPRRLGVFAESIMRGTISQDEKINWWVKSYAHLHFDGSPFVVKDNGVDNRGYVIIESHNRPEFREPDYLLKSETHPNVLLEYKDCPCTFKATYKVKDLENIVNFGANILTIHTNRDGERVFYTVMMQKMAGRLLDELWHRNYKEVGGKLGVQINENRSNGVGLFEDYLKKYPIDRC